MAKVLIASPVRQEPEILREFLVSLQQLDTTGLHVSYCFVDDNDDPTSKTLLANFVTQHEGVLLSGQSSSTTYRRDNTTHTWPEDAIWRVAAYKDSVLEMAVDEGYDAVFLVDSDLILHPSTLRQLWASRKDIISEIFWTRWKPDEPELPQVWRSGQYGLDEEFVDQLRWYGVYRVGGLGACTLIRSRALRAGVRFEQVPGLGLVGEDRHFCARAAALGFGLYVDTHFPAYHIYRSTDLAGVSRYRTDHLRRQVEVEIVQSARRTLEAWGTSHWQTITGLEGVDGLAHELRLMEMQRKDEKIRVARERRTTAYTKVTGIKVDVVDLAHGVAQLRCTLVNEGVDKDEPFLDELLGAVMMTREDGRWLVADVTFSNLEEEGSLNRRVQYLLSRAYELLEAGRAHEARTLLLRHKRYVTQEPDLVAALADAVCAEGNYAAAKQFLTEALTELPEHPTLLCSLARLLERGGRHTAAWKLYEMAARSKSTVGVARVRQAEIGEQVTRPQTIMRTRKKQIALVYHSYSGSNTVALYKLSSRAVRDRYDLKLVRASHHFSTRLETLDSDLVITTHGYYPLDPGQPNLDLWHGFPLKAMGFMDKQEDHSRFGGHWRHTSKIASYSPLFNTLMNACIGKTINHYVVTGVPRNDFLFVTDGRRNLSRLLGQSPGDQRIVLFMPTFRLRPGASTDGVEPWDNFQALGLGDQGFERFLRENDILLLLKLHPAEEKTVLQRLDTSRSPRIRVIQDDDLERNEMDLYEILNAVDVLITDYSSVYFDYLLLDRPIVFFAPDCEEYRQTRGFLLEPYDFWTPGPKVVDRRELQDQLLYALSNASYYHAQREQVASLVHQYRDGAATERVWRVVEEMLG